MYKLDSSVHDVNSNSYQSMMCTVIAIHDAYHSHRCVSVCCRAKTTSRRSRSSVKENVQRDSLSKDIFQFDPLTKDAGHHPGDSYKDGLRDKMASRVPMTPNISTNSSKVKSLPSYQGKDSPG